MKWSRIEEEREIEELEREGMGLKHAWRGVGDERLMTIKKKGGNNNHQHPCGERGVIYE
ncbi:hypothetical protein GLYMA_05G175700v4 [Glycine max]|uniref:Uncharacterized protein n=1 Tax=Glycine max TaxID=3847 RepID=K7KQW0_SOYBN|nr:hypothetical protein GYH30_012986 [Glycine max]KRH59291.1 hypothetical protein GLYMA_05G175700v4 [Glycine max]